MKTSELAGPALVWAVAKCNGVECDENHEPIWFEDTDDYNTAPRVPYTPPTDWAQGGPIIEREGLTLTHQADRWAAQTDDDLFAYGPTPLIAAMRCYVASKLGDTVDIPEELK